MAELKELQALVSRLRVPTLPGVVQHINALIADRTCGPQEIGRVVAGDPSLTAQVLRLANSSFYGLEEPVLSAEQAATVIGVRALRNIALQASIITGYEHLAAHDGFDLEEVWKHAAATAQISQMLGTLSKRAPKLAPDEYFTCGLLHDIGKVVLLDSLGEEYLEILRRARSERQALHLEEERALGCSHVHVGALLAGEWGLPQEISTAISFHHGPVEQIRSNPVVAVVAVADQIAYRVHGPAFEDASERLSEVAQKVLDVTEEAFDRVVAAAAGQAGLEAA